ncbi:glycosyltransferase [Myxococcus xanthus]|uniref:Glycosyltransferase n=1 Tax=Myxococcus xanthus TaxID=34 RepID=A0A7Y4MNQ6_MYXXA|nr:glycosyltransferase [Myxococcus xanthus]NOJ77036.1 glycosyltransferase [Myxococcus xanthus]NOJ89172.1 glycosyltransferase [Myxococcus xanthus]
MRLAAVQVYSPAVRRFSPSRVPSLRICLVSKELAPFNRGDIATYVATMSRALAEAGHEVHVLTAANADWQRAVSYLPGVHLHAVDEREVDFKGAFPHAPLRHAWAAYRSLLELNARHPFDVIEFPDDAGEGYFAMRARRTLGHFEPAVLAVRLHDSTHDRLLLNRVATLDMDIAQREHMEDTSIREADLVLSPSGPAMERVRTRLELKRAGVVIPPPFAARWEHRASPRIREGLPQVLYVGDLEYRKGVHLLVEAMQGLFEQGVLAEVRLIGDDTRTGPFGRSLRQWLEQRIAPAWRSKFHFAPSLEGADLASALAEATVCCIPSRWEHFSHVCMEAMSAGALVVGSDGGGNAELIEDGQSGLLFRSDDVSRLARALERALATPALQEAVRQTAPARIASYCAPASIVRQFEAAVADARRHRHVGPVSPMPRKKDPATPYVSILVPYYNMGRYLPETLRSIRAQTFTDYEIILVDDGSTDSESRALLETLHAPDLHILRQPNGGLSAARNAGLRAARGRYVLPLDPDDLIQPTFLEKAVAVMDSTPGLAYVTSLVSYFVEAPDQPIGGWIPWGTERDALLAENVASTCTALMERQRIEEIGGYDEWLTAYEDWDVFCSLAERGLAGSVIPEPLFLYRLRPDSMTRSMRVNDRHAQMAYLCQKHPALPLHPERALRMQLGRAHRQELHLRATGADSPPLLNRFADKMNATLKRFDFAHATLRRAALWVAGADDDSRPLRHQVMERFFRRRP